MDGQPALRRRRPYASAALRRLLWRLVLLVTGGFGVAGRLPPGGCVVVANHSSHADTAALLAALDARHRPHVAAAADYWFSSTLKGQLCQLLAAGFPVRRSGGGSTDLAGAEQQLRAGRAIVLFGEGTRSRDGEIAQFRTGPARLAQRAGVPLVGVGLHGTAQLFPVHGRPRLGQPVTVSIGRPIEVRCPEQATELARAEVAELATRAACARVDPVGFVAESWKASS